MATILGMIVSEPPPDLQVHDSHLDPQLNALCQRALGKEPAGRFQSGKEFADAIDAYLSRSPGEGNSAPESPGHTSTAQKGLLGKLKSIFK
jgi:hypothetical protein